MNVGFEKVFLMQNTMNEKELDNRIMEYLDENFEMDDMQYYILNRKKPGHIFMMVNAAEETLVWDKFEPVLRNLHKQISNDLNLNSIVAAGSVYDSVLRIPISAREAMSSIYYGISNMPCSIIRYNDIDVEHITNLIPNVTAAINGAVKSGDVSEIRNIMKDLREKFTANYLSKHSRAL